MTGRSANRVAASAVALVEMIAVGWLLGAAEQPSLAAEKRPNVLFIVVDDLRPELGCYGSSVKSPNIDRLATEGLLFNRVYCQTALCMPSRSSVLSGYRPTTLRNGIEPLTGNAPQGTVTLPGLFRANGYTTVSIGKVYHYNTDDPDGWVRRYRDTFTEGIFCDGYCSGFHLAENRANLANYFMPLKGASEDLPRPSMSECVEAPDEACPDGIVAVRAMGELKKFSLSGEPFFLAAGFYRPHLPWTPPKRYWDMYDRTRLRLPADFHAPDDGIPRANWDEMRRYGDAPKQGPMPPESALKAIHGYCASVSFVDAQIGKVLDELRRLELNKNTIVILWSDNGWNLGDHGAWSKNTNFETSTRVTMMISGPKLPSAQKTDALAELIDIYPSLCELCGLTPPDYLEGTSFVPLLQSPKRPWKVAAFSCLTDYTTLTIRTDRYRFIQRASGQNELYDHRTDSAEDHNLASDPDQQQVVQELQATLKGGWQWAKPPRRN